MRSKAPEPRRELWQQIKSLASWDGKDSTPRSGDWRTSSPVTPGCVWIVSEAFENGERVIKCLYAAPRSSVYESFQEILLDELTD